MEEATVIIADKEYMGLGHKVTAGSFARHGAESQ